MNKKEFIYINGNLVRIADVSVITSIERVNEVKKIKKAEDPVFQFLVVMNSGEPLIIESLNEEELKKSRKKIFMEIKAA